MIPLTTLGELVNRYALKYELRPDVVACIILQESNGNPFAIRFERKFCETKLATKDRAYLFSWYSGSGEKPSLETERTQRATSFGLMQCLGETLRWCVKSKQPFLTAYCDPELGIDAGCHVLAYYLERGGNDYREALKGYNGVYSYADEIFERVRRGEHKRFFQGD